MYTSSTTYINERPKKKSDEKKYEIIKLTSAQNADCFFCVPNAIFIMCAVHECRKVHSIAF